MTSAEKKLWRYLRKKQINNLQFYRQKPLLNNIVDFYCPKKKLIIEVDGRQHYTNKVIIAKDQMRDREFLKINIKTLRFTNSMVMKNIDKVIKIIQNHTK